MIEYYKTPSCQLLFTGLDTGEDIEVIDNSAYFAHPVSIRAFRRNFTRGIQKRAQAHFRQTPAIRCLCDFGSPRVRGL